MTFALPDTSINPPELLGGSNYSIKIGSVVADIDLSQFVTSVKLKGDKITLSFSETLDGSVSRALNDVRDASVGHSDINFLVWEFLSPQGEPVLCRVFEQLLLIKEETCTNDLSQFLLTSGPLIMQKTYSIEKLGSWMPSIQPI